ncbi:MAG: phosphoribosyltransferase [Chthonomonadaceae bacterium]|nr:phosphoribosyltransferase [Chthonomonadaceae bacterium]
MATETPDGTLIFEDRTDAGRFLAGKLTVYKQEDPIVLALPRGGVVVGYEIARALNAPLDVIVARKLGAPGHEELGIGAIAPGDVRVLDERTIHWLGITDEQLQRVIAKETLEMNRRLRLYRGDRPLPEVRDKTVILVDDGLATGVTAQAAILSLRRQQPRRLIVAIPVCAPETAERLRTEVDELTCLSTPAEFRAVGLWYRRFEQTTDQEVIDLLARANQEVAAVV